MTNDMNIRLLLLVLEIRVGKIGETHIPTNMTAGVKNS